MGSSVVRALLKYTDSKINICDRNFLDISQMFPHGIDRVTYTRLDAIREETIPSAISGSSIVINCIGPFYRYGEIIARSVIGAGISGVDICNDSNAITSLLALDDEARKRNVTYITSLGFSPGLSNLFAMRAASSLETVEKVSIGWVSSIDELSGQAQIEHLMYLVNEKVPFYSRRTRTRVDAFSGTEMFKFPYPVGLKKLSHMGYPEVITLSEYMDVNEVSVKGGLIPSWTEFLIRAAGKTGISKDGTVREKVASIFHMTSRYAQFHIRKKNLGNAALRVNVTGIRKGARVQISCGTINKLENLLAYPVVTGAVFLANGEIEVKGVYPPEGCIDEERALNWMSRCGLVYTYSEKFLEEGI